MSSTGHVLRFADRVLSNVERVIIGKRDALELVLLGLLSGGHLLIEDVPGVGKTMLARSLARSLGCSFRRIQFTPDMLPSDVTGVYVFNQLERRFDFRPGPVIAQIVLADEINRATPKTQSALLEAMGEGQVTVDGITHALPTPFMVMATQNPIEHEGTFPLPEAQLDRFLLRIRLGYAELEDEIRILEGQQLRHPLEDLGQVGSVQDLLQAQEEVKRLFVSPAVKRYIVLLVRAIRRHPDVYLGPSPRASLSLFRNGQARAAVQGRDHVLPDDVKALAPSALEHRIILAPRARLRAATPFDILEEVLREVEVPAGAPQEASTAPTITPQEA